MYYLCFVTCDLENSKVVQMAVVGPCTVQFWISAVFKKKIPQICIVRSLTFLRANFEFEFL